MQTAHALHRRTLLIGGLLLTGVTLPVHAADGQVPGDEWIDAKPSQEQFPGSQWDGDPKAQPRMPENFAPGSEGKMDKSFPKRFPGSKWESGSAQPPEQVPGNSWQGGQPGN